MKEYKPVPGPLLAQINNPDDLRKLSLSQLESLAYELRSFILDVVSVHPGHLGASLGVVELTVVVHYVFNTPYDRLIWDVGHQAYAHKILTGRRDIFHTNRKYKGISGFPSRKESPYDAFGTGHASTSVSAALGMATAATLKGETDRQHIAVIGDGALTGGMAIEALNNAGASKANLLVILNDNGIAIDKSAGAIKDYLAQIAISGAYTNFNNFFKALHFSYFGPVDGHNIEKLTRILYEVKNIKGPRLLHIVTIKGKGFDRAEKEQTLFHAPGKFNRITGELVKTDNSIQHTYCEVYGRTLLELAESNKKIVAITPAMPTGSALNFMMKRFPGRVFDVGIAEQHAVTFAAGLAAEGMIPFCTIYSTFLQRAIDQLIHDVALQRLPVVFGIDRAGLVGADGATHHGFFDIAFLSVVPNIVVSAPMNESELRNMMFTATKYRQGPFAIRYPRGRGVLEHWKSKFQIIPVGKGRTIVETESNIAIISIGHAGNMALEACKQLKNEIAVAIYDMRFVKPLDEKLLEKVMRRYKNLITVEDGMLSGGFGSLVANFANSHSFCNVKIKNLGIPNRFVEQGSQQDLYAECGFDVNGIIKTIREMSD